MTMTMRLLRTSPIFAFYVLATLLAAGIIGLITFDIVGPGMAHFGTAEHRTHDVTYGLIFSTGVVGVFAQLWRPEKNIAPMIMALFPGGSLLLAGFLVGNTDAVFRFNPLRYAAAVTVVAVLLHPAGRAFFRSFERSRMSPVMLALVGVAAVPLLLSASTNIGFQSDVADVHAGMGHYGFMAAFSFTAVAVGVLASLRPDGWRLTAWVAGALPAVLGIASLLYPDASSSWDPAWALTAVAWCAAFVAAAEIADRAERPIRSEHSPEEGRPCTEVLSPS